MQPSISEPYRPSSIIVHNLINKLSVIIGRCDLMMDMAEDETEWANRLLEIRELAKSMAHEIVQDRPIAGALPNCRGRTNVGR